MRQKDRLFRESQRMLRAAELRMKVRDILHWLHDQGWRVVAVRGSHRQLKHPHRPGRVTVPGKPSDDLTRGLLDSILKQASRER
jgi:predicted RNA binding protein YcfA (HicA-like mRNA interferase family)